MRNENMLSYLQKLIMGNYDCQQILTVETRYVFVWYASMEDGVENGHSWNLRPLFISQGILTVTNISYFPMCCGYQGFESERVIVNTDHYHYTRRSFNIHVKRCRLSKVLNCFSEICVGIQIMYPQPLEVFQNKLFNVIKVVACRLYFLFCFRTNRRRSEILNLFYFYTLCIMRKIQVCMGSCMNLYFNPYFIGDPYCLFTQLSGQ